MIVIGDTHGLAPVAKLINKYSLTGCNLIHVGDFGLGFNLLHHDLYYLDVLDTFLQDKDNTLYVIRGNHDNPFFWDTGNLKHKRIHLVKDYSVITIENKSVLFVGGAISIDRTARALDNPASWWHGEKFYLDKDRINNLQEKIDMVITHSAPAFCNPVTFNYIVNKWHKTELEFGLNLKKDLKVEREEHSELYHLLKTNGHPVANWAYGHFHICATTTVDNTTFHALDINGVKEIK